MFDKEQNVGARTALLAFDELFLHPQRSLIIPTSEVLVKQSSHYLIFTLNVGTLNFQAMVIGTPAPLTELINIE